MKKFIQYLYILVLIGIESTFFSSAQAAIPPINYYIGHYGDPYQFAGEVLDLPFRPNMIPQATRTALEGNGLQQGIDFTSPNTQGAFKIIAAFQNFHLAPLVSPYNIIWHQWALDKNFVQWEQAINIQMGLLTVPAQQPGIQAVGDSVPINRMAPIQVFPHGGAFSPNNAIFEFMPGSTIAFFWSVATHAGQTVLAPTLFYKNQELHDLLTGLVTNEIFYSQNRSMTIDDLIKLLRMITAQNIPALDQADPQAFMAQFIHALTPGRFNQVLPINFVNLHGKISTLRDFLTNPANVRDFNNVTAVIQFLETTFTNHVSLNAPIDLIMNNAGAIMLAARANPGAQQHEDDFTRVLRQSAADAIANTQQQQEYAHYMAQAIAESIRTNALTTLYNAAVEAEITDASDFIGLAMSLNITDPNIIRDVVSILFPSLAENIEVALLESGLISNQPTATHRTMSFQPAPQSQQPATTFENIPPLIDTECSICNESPSINFIGAPLCPHCLGQLQIQGTGAQMGIHELISSQLIPAEVFAYYNVEPNASNIIAEQPSYVPDSSLNPLITTFIDRLQNNLINENNLITSMLTLQQQLGRELTEQEATSIGDISAMRTYEADALAFRREIRNEVRILNPNFTGTGPFDEPQINAVIPLNADRSSPNNNSNDDDDEDTVVILQPSESPTDQRALGYFNQIKNEVRRDINLDLTTHALWNRIFTENSTQLQHFQEVLLAFQRNLKEQAQPTAIAQSTPAAETECYLCDSTYDQTTHRRIALHTNPEHPEHEHALCAECLGNLQTVGYYSNHPCPSCREIISDDIYRLNNITPNNADSYGGIYNNDNPIFTVPASSNNPQQSHAVELPIQSAYGYQLYPEDQQINSAPIIQTTPPESASQSLQIATLINEISAINQLISQEEFFQYLHDVQSEGLYLDINENEAWQALQQQIRNPLIQNIESVIAPQINSRAQQQPSSVTAQATSSSSPISAIANLIDDIYLINPSISREDFRQYLQDVQNEGIYWNIDENEAWQALLIRRTQP